MTIKVGLIINTKIHGNVGVRIMKIKTALEHLYGSLEIDIIYKYEELHLIKLKKILFSIFNGYHIIHIFEPSWPSMLFLLFFKTLRRKIIYQSGDLHFSTGDLVKGGKFTYYYMKFNERLHYYFADVSIVGSIGLRNFLVNIFLIPEKKVRRLLVFTIPTVNRTQRTSDLRDESLEFFRKDEFLMAYSATLREINIGGTKLSRGWEIPFILKKLKEMGLTRVKILVLGEGPGKKFLELEARRMGVIDSIDFTGKLEGDDYYAALERCDLCLVESLDHISYKVMDPTKVSDYLAVGRPFVIGRTPESELWKDYPLIVEPPKLSTKLGFEAESYIIEITGKILQFFLDGEFRKKCYTEIQKIIAQAPSWDDVATEIMLVYENLVK